MSQKISVIIPVFNVKDTILNILSAVQVVDVDKKILIVDDGSTDGTRKILADRPAFKNDIRVIFHEKNQGKEKAVQTGIANAEGDYVLIQDVDMEFDPRDYKILLDVIQKTGAAIVYGSRFLSGKKVTSFWHKAVNSFLTQLTNVLYGSHLTDMETCYKFFRVETIKKNQHRVNGF